MGQACCANTNLAKDGEFDNEMEDAAVRIQANWKGA